jgi:hypothetical protein
MLEHHDQKGSIEASFEAINPRYHVYKGQEEKLQKHSSILQEYQQRSYDTDPLVEEIVKDINEKLQYAQEQKKVHTVLEDKYSNLNGREVKSMTQIRQQYLKKYKVPLQYRHIFGIVMDKINNFYNIRAAKVRKASNRNNQLFENLAHSSQD